MVGCEEPVLGSETTSQIMELRESNNPMFSVGSADSPSLRNFPWSPFSKKLDNKVLLASGGGGKHYHERIGVPGGRLFDENM